MSKQIPARLKKRDILRPKWQWLDHFPSDDPVLANVKEKNATANARVAVFMWRDDSIARMTCFGWPDFPPADDESIKMLYSIARAHMEQLAREELKRQAIGGSETLLEGGEHG